MRFHLIVALLAFPAWTAAVPAAAADRALSYVVLKDGEPIGHETVAIHQGDGRTSVEVETETRVKVLFLDFHYHHRRTEDWTGDRLERLVADTDDDGTPHHIEARLDGTSTRLTVDGAARDLPADALPLTLWGKAILSRVLLYSIVDATPFRVAVTPLGGETLTLAGHPVAAEHYRLSGEVDRELWYGPDGLLLKVAFERRGYPIEFIRE